MLRYVEAPGKKDEKKAFGYVRKSQRKGSRTFKRGDHDNRKLLIPPKRRITSIKWCIVKISIIFATNKKFDTLFIVKEIV